MLVFLRLIFTGSDLPSAAPWRRGLYGWMARAVQSAQRDISSGSDRSLFCPHSPSSCSIQPLFARCRGLADLCEAAKARYFLCKHASNSAWHRLLIHNNKYSQSGPDTQAIAYLWATAPLLRSGVYCECDKFLFIIPISYSLASHHAAYLTMIVCVCRRVSDKEIARHAHAGMSFDEIQFELGVGLQCGCCEGCARDVVEQCSASRPVAALRNEAAVHPVQLATTIMESKAWNSSPLSSVA